MPETPRESTGSGRGPAVVYFAKAPLPGLCKTRLCPPLTPAEAAGLYRGFLQDGVRPVAGARTLVYGWPARGLDELAALVPPAVELRPQVGDSLGARLAACFDELLGEGHPAVVIRNTDSPDLPPVLVADAVARCAEGTVVLGPDLGGGYYLVGLARPAPELFAVLAEVEPGAVHAATVERARALGLAVVELEPQPDVDLFADLLACWRRRGGGGQANP